MQTFSYFIIDDNQESALATQAMADNFQELQFLGTASNYSEALSGIREHHPKLVFLEIDPINKDSNLSLGLINELHQYLELMPFVVVTTTRKELAFEAIQHQVTDYILKPLKQLDFIKLVLKLKKIAPRHDTFNSLSKLVFDIQNESEKNRQKQQDSPLILCLKSYTHYRYIDTSELCYLQADNNSTDFHMLNGEVITAFKTLKYFENILPHPFYRVHNSFMVNCNFVNRLHWKLKLIYIKNTKIKIPLSDSYKPVTYQMMEHFSSGNFIEI